MKRIAFAIVCAAMSMALSINAATLTINNPGFEADLLGNGVFSYTLTGWTPNLGCCGIGFQNPTTGMFASGTSIEGDNFAYGNGGGFGYYQVLSNTFAPNTTYTFSMMVGHRLDLGFGGYLLALRAGPSFLTPAVASLTGASDPGSGQWALQSLVYSTSFTGAELGQSILISFGSNGIQTEFDQATVTATPEPATLGLIGASLVAVGVQRKKKFFKS